MIRRTTIDLEEDLWLKLRDYAGRNRTSMVDVIRALLTEQLDKPDGPCIVPAMSGPFKYESPAAMKDGYEYDPITKKNVKKPTWRELDADFDRIEDAIDGLGGPNAVECPRCKKMVNGVHTCSLQDPKLPKVLPRKS